MQRPVLCCPEPSVRNPLHPHEVPNSSTGIPTTPGYACSNPLFVSTCGPAEPPEPITLEGQDCDGAPVSATGLPGQITHVVQAPDTVFKVQLCTPPKDIEKVVLCDKNTDHKVAVISDLTDPAVPVVTFWDLNTGAPWAGDIDDLVQCPDVDLESDPVEMCDAGTQFLRWVVKKDGEPTTIKFDTTASMQPYVVTDEANVTIGKCVAAAVCEPTISSASGNTLIGLLPGTSVSIQKNNCCTLKVTTSAGSFIVSKDVTGYSTGDFKCPVTVTAVEILSGTCALADVIVTTQFSG